MRYYQLSATGQLHKMESGHAGAGASNPIPENLVTLSKYELCNQPNCFGRKHEFAGALKVAKEADEQEVDLAGALKKPERRSRRLSHGVTATE